MAELKTKVNDAIVADFINTVPDGTKRADCFTLLEIFRNITGQEPKMWGSSIIGYGSYHYKSERSRQEGDWPLIGFSPRKQNLTLYIMSGFGDLTPELEKLGKHKISKGCLYIHKLADVDLDILRQIIRKSYSSAKSQYANR